MFAGNEQGYIYTRIGIPTIAALEQNVRANDVDVMNGQRAAKLLPAGDDGLIHVELASGAVLKVSATDAGSQRDFRAFASLAGHALLHEEVDSGIYRYWLRKA